MAIHRVRKANKPPAADAEQGKVESHGMEAVDQQPPPPASYVQPEQIHHQQPPPPADYRP